MQGNILLKALCVYNVYYVYIMCMMYASRNTFNLSLLTTISIFSSNFNKYGVLCGILILCWIPKINFLNFINESVLKSA